MKIIGVIAEYNPFHNGHLYHLNKIKELYPDSLIVVVLSGHFMQRGEPSIISKWDRTELALEYGADIVIELPFPFATQSADIFAKGAIQILKQMHVDTLIFGSETDNVDKLIELSNIDLENKESIQSNLDRGMSYAKATYEYLKDASNELIQTPNDILGLAYIKSIKNEHANIIPITIKRTNDYHSTDLNGSIVSASAIRKALYDGKDISTLVPKLTLEKLNNNLFFQEDYFPFYHYKMVSEINRLEEYQTVDEGLENRIKKEILNATSLDDFILRVKTKRYTYNKIRRMLTHILVGFTKEEAKKYKHISYIRILGFTKKGQHYLNQIKKNMQLPIITKFKKENDPMLELEFRATMVYASILNQEEQKKIIEQEYKQKPIIKD